MIHLQTPQFAKRALVAGAVALSSIALSQNANAQTQETNTDTVEVVKKKPKEKIKCKLAIGGQTGYAKYGEANIPLSGGKVELDTKYKGFHTDLKAAAGQMLEGDVEIGQKIFLNKNKNLNLDIYGTASYVRRLGKTNSNEYSVNIQNEREEHTENGSSFLSDNVSLRYKNKTTPSVFDTGVGVGLGYENKWLNLRGGAEAVYVTDFSKDKNIDINVNGNETMISKKGKTEFKILPAIKMAINIGKHIIINGKATPIKGDIGTAYRF